MKVLGSVLSLLGAVSIGGGIYGIDAVSRSGYNSELASFVSNVNDFVSGLSGVSILSPEHQVMLFLMQYRFVLLISGLAVLAIGRIIERTAR